SARTIDFPIEKAFKIVFVDQRIIARSLIAQQIAAVAGAPRVVIGSDGNAKTIRTCGRRWYLRIGASFFIVIDRVMALENHFKTIGGLAQKPAPRRADILLMTIRSKEGAIVAVRFLDDTRQTEGRLRLHDRQSDRAFGFDLIK